VRRDAAVWRRHSARFARKGVVCYMQGQRVACVAARNAMRAQVRAFRRARRVKPLGAASVAQPCSERWWVVAAQTARCLWRQRAPLLL